MENNDLTSAILKVHGIQSFQGGGAAGLGAGMPPPEEMMMQAMAAEGAPAEDRNAVIANGIEEMMMQAQATEDPTERSQYNHLAEAAEIGASAPMAEMAIQLAQAGRGEDSALAHLRPGEVILPPEAFEDAEFEAIVERKFNELEIDPEQMVVGVGIASLNPITGLEEFGFFKKLAKGIKKVVKKVVKPLAKVAQFIPGPWQPIAALANKAFTVYDVAKGRANPLSLLTVAGPMATGGTLGQNIGDITKAGGGSFFRGLGSGVVGAGQGAFSGIGSLIKNPIGTFTGSAPGGGIPGLFKSATMSGQAKLSDADMVDQLRLTSSPDWAAHIEIMEAQGALPSDILQSLGVSPASFFNPQGSGQFMPGQGGQQNFLQRMISGTPGNQNPFQEFMDDQLGFDPSGGGIYNMFGGGGQGQGGGMFGGGGGGMFGGGLGSLAAAGIPAYLLGKMAYDEAKADKGVPLTPLTTMGPTGRYNIEAEIARRMGTQSPNPIEYGLLPRGTIPTLSGGQPMTAAHGGAVRPMAYANGGNVAMEDFNRMNGQIDGPGSETSDSIPAMLSDGEFVMTGEAVRGAGGYDLNNQDGILTLIPAGAPNRERGTNLMYDMMGLFADYASDSGRAANV